MGKMATPAQGSKTLNSLWFQSYKKYQATDTCSFPSISDEYQTLIKSTRSLVKETLDASVKADLFSDTEEVDDIATGSLRFLVLHYWLGELTMKMTAGLSRMILLKQSKKYFEQFLNR